MSGSAVLDHAEREATRAMLDRRERGQRITLRADKAHDVEAFIVVL